MEEKEKGDEVTGGRHAIGPNPAVAILRPGASDCESHKGGSGVGNSNRQEMTAAYHHPHRSGGSLSDRAEGRRSLPLNLCDAHAGVTKNTWWVYS